MNDYDYEKGGSEWRPAFLAAIQGGHSAAEAEIVADDAMVILRRVQDERSAREEKR